MTKITIINESSNRVTVVVKEGRTVVEVAASDDAPRSSRLVHVIGAGGGGSSHGGGGMEVKTVRLEAHMSQLQDCMGEVKQRSTGSERCVGAVEAHLAALPERIAQLPSKGYFVTTVLLAGSFLTTVTLFSDGIKKLLGL